jgi:ferredoxin
MADVSCCITSEETHITAYSGKGTRMLSCAGLPVNRGDRASTKAATAGWERSEAEEFLALKTMPRKERLNFWLEQFSKCIKCFGCKNACPLCYCKDCYLGGERGLITRGELPPEIMFHLTRLAHVGDSCLNCGMCEAVCPAEIPLSKLSHMLYKEMNSILKYESGVEFDSLPPLTSGTEEELNKGDIYLD